MTTPSGGSNARARPHPAQARAVRGMTLISVLVGLTIAALCALVCTNILLNYQLAVADMSESSAHNRQLTFGVMAAEREIGRAGFGISDADASDIVVVSEAPGGSVPGSVSVLWRSREDGSIVCQGLREDGTTYGNVAHRVLRVVESVADCNESAALDTLAFDGEIGVLGQWPVLDELATYIASNDTLFDFSLATGTCSPYGALPPSTRLIASISAPSVAELNGVSVTGTGVSLCLLNIDPA